MPSDGATRSKGVQSVEVGMQVLRAFCYVQGPMSLTQIAKEVNIAPAKLHRYLVSLIESGMVIQRKTGTYDLGRSAAEVGMAAVARYDVINRAADALPEIVEETDCTAMLSVWGTLGPTVVRWERSNPPLVTALGIGTILPLTTSATGMAFLSWSPERVVRDLVSEDELEGVLSQRSKILANGLAEAQQTFIPGLYALAAPVLDLQGRAEGVVTLVSNSKKIMAKDSAARSSLTNSFPTSASVSPGLKSAQV